MTQDTLQSIVVSLVVAWGVAAVLALIAVVRVAAVINALVSGCFMATALPPLAAALFDRTEYVRRYGMAALSELPLDAAILGLGALGLALSVVAAIGGGRIVFGLAWLTNGPSLAFAVYMAFWFHIFG